MELMISTFTLAIAAAISIIIAQAIDKVSVNYISMLVGIIIGLIPFLNSQIASFDSEIFMELIVAPLLFFEGQKTRIHNISRRIKEIIAKRNHPAASCPDIPSANRPAIPAGKCRIRSRWTLA